MEEQENRKYEQGGEDGDYERDFPEHQPVVAHLAECETLLWTQSRVGKVFPYPLKASDSDDDCAEGDDEAEHPGNGDRYGWTPGRPWEGRIRYACQCV